MKVNVENPYSAAKVACSRIILARGSGYQEADRDDAIQEAALAAARANDVFTRKGLPETKTGRAGYQVRAARNAAVAWAIKMSRQRSVECALTENYTIAPPAEAADRDMLAAIIEEVREIVGGKHAIVAAELLGADTATKTMCSPRAQVQFLAHEILNTTTTEVARIVDELVVYLSLRRSSYGA